MNRRSFLGWLGAGVAGIALEKAIPFGRVWSFPKKIIVPNDGMLVGTDFAFRVPMRWIVRDGLVYNPEVLTYQFIDMKLCREIGKHFIHSTPLGS